MDNTELKEIANLIVTRNPKGLVMLKRVIKQDKSYALLLQLSFLAKGDLKKKTDVLKMRADRKDRINLNIETIYLVNNHYFNGKDRRYNVLTL